MYYRSLFGSGLLASFIILHTGGLLGCTLPGQQEAAVQSVKGNNLALPASCLYLHSFLSPASDPLPFISESCSLFSHLSHHTMTVSLSCCLLAVGRSPRTRLISWLVGNSKTNKPKSLFKNCVNKRIFWGFFSEILRDWKNKLFMDKSISLGQMEHNYSGCMWGFSYWISTHFSIKVREILQLKMDSSRKTSELSFWKMFQ